MSFLIIKLQEEKSYHVSPHVASNFYEPPSHTTCRIKLVGSCVTGISQVYSDIKMSSCSFHCESTTGNPCVLRLTVRGVMPCVCSMDFQCGSIESCFKQAPLHYDLRCLKPCMVFNPCQTNKSVKMSCSQKSLIDL